MFDQLGLLKEVRSECKRLGIRLYLSKGRFVRWGSNRSNGYFNPETNTLAVATGGPNWILRTLSHEYGHMKQWDEDCPTWRTYMKWATEDRSIFNPKVSQRVRSKVVKATYELELDCEKRSVETLTRFGYTRIEDYIQKAHAYTMFYFFIEEHCKWYEIGREPFLLESVWSKFPKTFECDAREVYASLGHLFWQCVKGSAEEIAQAA